MTSPLLILTLFMADAPPADPQVLPVSADVLLTAANDQDVAPPPPPVPPPSLSVPPVVPTLPPSPDAVSDDQGAIVVTGAAPAPSGDPLEKVNAQSYEATQQVDKAILGPAALAYKEQVPGLIRKGLRNFLKNLREPVVFLNFLLQIKPGKAAETVGRFTINSTIGALGLVDVAKKRPFNLPYRRNGFANSLGYYGVKPGAFLYLPLLGATTVRDLVGDTLDRFVVPLAVGKPFNQPLYSIPTTVVGVLDGRAEFDAQKRKLQNDAVDPYAATRDYYLRTRQAEIDALRGKRSIVADHPSP